MVPSTLLALVFLAASVLALPANSTLPRRRAAQVYTSCTKPNTAALTFDDGPYEYLYTITNTLEKAGAKGTFFFNGNNWRCIYDEGYADRVKYAYDHGHQIASHTWSHAYLTSLSTDQLNDEMGKIEEAFKKIAGVTPAFMRPPYGEYNNDVTNVAGARGQDVVIWNLDSGDSVGATVAQSKQNYDDMISEHPDTILTLNHETYKTTAETVLPYAIKKLQAAGYKLVTVAECVGKQPYRTVGKPSARDSSWSC